MDIQYYNGNNWARLHRIAGYFFLIIGIYWGILFVQNKDGRNYDKETLNFAYYCAIYCGSIGLGGLFSAFLIDKLAEIAHYAKITAERSAVNSHHVYKLFLMVNKQMKNIEK